MLPVAHDSNSCTTGSVCFKILEICLCCNIFHNFSHLICKQQYRQIFYALYILFGQAGIVCSLPARTSIIAAANPIGGHYNKAKTVSENLKMNSALLSRFELLNNIHFIIRIYFFAFTWYTFLFFSFFFGLWLNTQECMKKDLTKRFIFLMF